MMAPIVTATTHPPPTDNDGTDSDGYDTPLPTTDNDGIDTPPPATDNDGTDSDGYDTPIPVDSRSTSGIQTQSWTVRPGRHLIAYCCVFRYSA